VACTFKVFVNDSVSSIKDMISKVKLR